MDHVSAIARIIVILLVVITIIGVLIDERRNYKFAWSIWRRFGIRMFLETVGIITLTIIITILLLPIPGLNFSWARLIFGYDGNWGALPIVESMNSSSIWIRLLAPAFCLVIIFCMPFLAKWEEEAYRKDYYDWGPILRQSVKFGLVHCLYGVPLAIGIALILPGLFYAFKYRGTYMRVMQQPQWWHAQEEALTVSITYHTMYNTILLGIILCVTTLMVF